jgi:predicted O-linked N-acetylglucosamine transferase (SPINDLY family)
MGLPYMDYIIADPTVIPPSQRSFYDEQVLYLPDSYLPVDTSLVIPDHTPTRAECGLPDDVMVYCSFNHDYKITPPVFSVWMNILRSVPGSVLWLMSRNSLSQDNLRAHAQAQGIDPQRLVFATRVPRVEDHLARYRQADLFLDTNPYNAHTTAADALMAGLPVLTCMGQSFPSRVAASLMQSLKMPELITESLQDYEARAILLGKDAALRQQTRERLARHKTDSSVFDTASLCRQLEALYTGIWRRTQLPAHGDALSPSLDC